jgi:hypothetical protein
MNKAEIVFEKLAFPKVLKDLKLLLKYQNKNLIIPPANKIIRTAASKKATKKALAVLKLLNS